MRGWVAGGHEDNLQFILLAAHRQVQGRERAAAEEEATKPEGEKK